jgi:hypothetical protein
LRIGGSRREREGHEDERDLHSPGQARFHLSTSRRICVANVRRGFWHRGSRPAIACRMMSCRTGVVSHEVVSREFVPRQLVPQRGITCPISVTDKNSE